MKDFKSHLFTFISIVLGLVVTQYLRSIGLMALNWEDLTINPIHAGYVVLSLALVMLYWWLLHDIAVRITDNFGYFLLYLAPSILMAMAHAHLFPWDNALYTTNGINDVFEDHKYGLAIVNAILLGLLALNSWVGRNKAMGLLSPKWRKQSRIMLCVRIVAGAWCLFIHERREAMADEIGLGVLLTLMAVFIVLRVRIDKLEDEINAPAPDVAMVEARRKLGEVETAWESVDRALPAAVDSTRTVAVGLMNRATTDFKQALPELKEAMLAAATELRAAQTELDNAKTANTALNEQVSKLLKPEKAKATGE